MRKHEWFRPIEPGHPRDYVKPATMMVPGGASQRQPVGLIANPTDHRQRCHNIAIWLIWSGFASALGVYRLLGKKEIREAATAKRQSKRIRRHS